MRTLILDVKRTKQTFEYPVTENVYQNLQDIMGGIVIGDHEIIELMDILVCLTEVKGVAMVAFDHAAEPDAEWEFSIYTGDEGSDERELVIVTAADFDENVLGDSLFGDIVDGMAACSLLPEKRRRRMAFVKSLSESERITAEILDAYFYVNEDSEGGRIPEMLMEYKTSAEIADDLAEMGVVDTAFITHYMRANGYRPTRRPSDEMLAWKIFKPNL